MALTPSIVEDAIIPIGGGNNKTAIDAKSNKVCPSLKTSNNDVASFVLILQPEFGFELTGYQGLKIRS